MKNVYLDLDNMTFIREKTSSPLSIFKRNTGWRQVKISCLDNCVFPAKANPSLNPFVQTLCQKGYLIKAMTASVSTKGMETLQGLNLLTSLQKADILNWKVIENGSNQRLLGRNCLVDDRGITSANTLRKLCYMHGVTWQNFINLPNFKQFNLALAMAKTELVIVPAYFGQLFYDSLENYIPVIQRKLASEPLDVATIIEHGLQHRYFKVIQRKVQNAQWYTLNKRRAPNEHKISGRSKIIKPLVQLIMA